MNKTIQELNKALSVNEAQRDEIREKLQVEWNKVFRDNQRIRDAVAALQESNDYGWNDYGEIVSYISFDLTDFKKCFSYFKEFMRSDHYVEVDDHGSLTYSQGYCIVINEDGDVLDQDGDKWFIKKQDYTDENGNEDQALRNKLIEDYMEKTGCFPGVFKTDSYGNVFLVNTSAGT